MLALGLARIYNSGMSNELPPSGDNSEYSSEFFESDDVGMLYLLDEMKRTEEALTVVTSEREAEVLYNELEKVYQEQILSKSEFFAKVHAKLRPDLRFNGEGEVESHHLDTLESRGILPSRDEVGSYRYLNGEEVEIIYPKRFATYNPMDKTVTWNRVGFWCQYSVDGKQIDGFLHPDDIMDITLSEPTHDGAYALLEQHEDYYKQLQVRQAPAEAGALFLEWVQLPLPTLPHITDAEAEHLRVATELYITHEASFDEEPYRLLLEGEVEIERPNESRKYIKLEKSEECYVYLDGVELRKKVLGPHKTWIPYLRGQLLTDSQLSEDTFYIPVSTVYELTPTLTRGGQFEALVLSTAEEQDSHFAQMERLAAQKQQEIAQRKLNAHEALRSFHRETESLDSQTLRWTMEDFQEAARYEDHMAVADELIEIYDIPFLAWQNDEKREEAAAAFRGNKLRAIASSSLNDDELAQHLKQEDEYQYRFARDEGMLRVVFLAALEKRLKPSMSSDEQAAIRQNLYTKLLVDYQEPIGSNWYELIDSFFPGEPITPEHQAIEEYKDELREMNRAYTAREAKIRNELSREFYNGLAVDIKDESYQIYRYLCEEVADVPFLGGRARQERIDELTERFALSAADVQKIVGVMGRVLNELA